jgi:endonuclease/exonuclease/phosphatase family metal-dependent hydrolase
VKKPISRIAFMLLFVLKAEQAPAFEHSLKEEVHFSLKVPSENIYPANKKNKRNLTANTKIRFATYNVLFGLWSKPESVGKMFKQYDLDVICLNEVPIGNWTLRVGRELGMEHVHVGKVSSANHKDKYKSILCRFPLRDKSEVVINPKGWKPASVVFARTNIKGVPLTLYSTHIPGQPVVEKSAASFIAKNMLSDSVNENLFVLGDFNNLLYGGALKAFKEAGMKSIWHGLSIDTANISTHRHIESGNESGVIDHIFYRSKEFKVQVTNGGIIETAFNSSEEEIDMSRYKKEWLKYGKPLSDHRPIWAEFTFIHD